MAEVRDVKPGPLHVSPNRLEGADIFKLIDQTQEYGKRFDDMPPLWVVEAAQRELVVYNGVTRATRAFLADPNIVIPVEIIDVLPFWDVSYLPTIKQLVEAEEVDP